MSETRKKALVLGATGGIGSETGRALERHGWSIRALYRSQIPGYAPESWEWVKGDAMDGGSVSAAAEGVDAIVHAVNPPGYRDWDRLVVPMIENTIAAAKRSGARILLPGTIYNYDPDALPVLREDSPQNATTHKGRIRIALERKLEQAAAAGVRSLIVRFGDFFGPKAGNNWFAQGMVKPNRPVTSITNPGLDGVGHDWTYVPDGAEAFARVMDREDELCNFERFHFQGHWDADGRQMIEAIRKATGKPDLPVKKLPWFVLKLASPFNETLREVYATRPLWKTPIRLENTKLVAFLGEEPHTPLDLAVETTLRGLGCI
jgi:nucleoside-diphosphate-sugar epimerase